MIRIENFMKKKVPLFLLKREKRSRTIPISNKKFSILHSVISCKGRNNYSICSTFSVIYCSLGAGIFHNKSTAYALKRRTDKLEFIY